MIDSHCHLDSKQFKGRQEQLLEAARKAGVHTVVNIGADLSSSVASVELAKANSMVYATVGIHPHDASSLDDLAMAQLEELAAHEKVVAIGEIGLDYYRDLSPRPIQKKAFHRQLELAVQMKLPVVIHTRQAFDDTIDIVREYARNLRGGVFHCFPGNPEDARQVIDLGFVIAIGGVTTFPNSQMAITATEVPLDKIIIETDAPYLAPVPHRGKLNEPANVKYVYEKLAQLKGLWPAEVERVVDRTCRKLYGLVETFGG